MLLSSILLNDPSLESQFAESEEIIKATIANCSRNGVSDTTVMLLLVS